MYHGDSRPDDQAADAAMAALYRQLDHLNLPDDPVFDTEADLRDLLARIHRELPQPAHPGQAERLPAHTDARSAEVGRVPFPAWPAAHTGEPAAQAGRRADDGAAGGQASTNGFRFGGPAHWVGRMSARTALLVLSVSALLGIIVTLVAGQEPGGLLGSFIIAGTIAAALGILRDKAHLLFPAPALASFMAAIVTGKVHDANLGSSPTALGAGFTQWAAGIFFPTVVATIVVLLASGFRRLLGRLPLSSASPPTPGKARPAAEDVEDDGSPDVPAPEPPQPGQSADCVVRR